MARLGHAWPDFPPEATFWQAVSNDLTTKFIVNVSKQQGYDIPNHYTWEYTDVLGWNVWDNHSQEAFCRHFTLWQPCTRDEVWQGTHTHDPRLCVPEGL